MKRPFIHFRIVILARLNVKMYFLFYILMLLRLSLSLRLSCIFGTIVVSVFSFAFVSFCVGGKIVLWYGEIRTYLILFYFLEYTMCTMHRNTIGMCAFRIDMPLNAKWAHLNCPTLLFTIMHFLGRQVNVCAFYTELLYIPTIASPKQYNRCERTMQTGKMHKMKRKNTQTNDIFNNIAELKKKLTHTSTHFKCTFHFPEFTLFSVHFSRAEPEKTRNFSASFTVYFAWMVYFLSQYFCCWWSISSYKWYSYHIAAPYTYIYRVTHTPFFCFDSPI